MHCPRCDQENPAGANFCLACGERLRVTCPACGSGNPEGARFCGGCGAPLAATPARPAAEAAAPRPAAGRIVTSREALEGERKQVTVLFADIKGSLEMVASRDPEEARELLDAVVERMMAAVHQYEGTVNQVMGDGIMALFGAPIAQEDHALRACYAALRMLETIGRHASDLRALGRPEPRVRIGLNSGEVLVRSFTSDLHMDYSAVGNTTHLAARMEQMAQPGTALITVDTLRLVEGHVEVRALGDVPVKGFATPMAVYELRRATGARSRLEAAAARGLTPFVGRQAERASLSEAVGRAAAGHGQVVAIVGEPGVGKSRLVWELIHSDALEGWVVLEAHALPHGATSPYLPIVELFRAYFKLDRDESAAATRDRVAAELGPEETARFMSPTLAVLGLSVDDPGWLALSNEQKRRRTLEAVRHLLTRRARSQPVCLVVEDLHWADPETLAVLDAVAEGVAASHLLLVVSYRPEHRHEWGGRTHYRHITVETFSAAETALVLDELIGRGPGVTPLRRMLVERTGGNPFFLEESVRNLVETGALAGDRGHLRIVKMPDVAHVPNSVQAVLAARIDRLRPEDKRVLQSASAVGKDVPRSLLEAVADAPGEALAESLARLKSGEFLHETRIFPDVEYTFRHALTHEVVYGGLVRERRHALDARIVAALESGAVPDDGRHADRLAHHAVRGELWDKAVTYCRQAGRQALARFAHRGAAAYFEQALGALARLPADGSPSELALDLRLELRYALMPLGQYRRIREILTEARELAERLDDRRRLGRISCYLCNFRTLRFEFAEAIEHGRAALAIADGLGDLALASAAQAMLALVHYALGDFERAAEMGRRAATAGSEAGRDRFGIVISPPIYGATIASWALAELGRFSEARRLSAEALARAEKAAQPHGVIFASLGAGVVALRQGEVTEALTTLGRALRLWEGADLPTVLLELAGPLASAYAEAGRADDALGLLDQAVAQAAALRHRLGNVLGSGGMAEAYLAAGRLDEALPRAQLYVQITKMVNGRGHTAWALHLLGEIAARVTPPDADTAESTLAESLALARELGMRPLEGRVLLSQATLLQRLGKASEACRVGAMAAEVFEGLGMPRWLAACRDLAARRARPEGGAGPSGDDGVRAREE